MTSSIRQLHPVEPVREINESRPRVEFAPNGPILINRDLSLLEFFNRVLEEALDPSQPVLERLKFLAIFSSNLDEFFMIRVSGLMEKLARHSEVSPDGFSRPQLLAEIKRRVTELMKIQMRCLKDEILPELARHGIVLAKYKDLTPEERKRIDKYFLEKVYPTLTPQAVDPTHPFPYISGGSINLALIVKPKLNKRVARRMENLAHEFFVRIKIPDFLSRFVPVDNDGGKFILMDDLVANNIKLFAPDADPSSVYQFRITRDADIYLREEEANDLLEMMEENLKQRRFGDVVRLEVCTSMPDEMLDHLTNSLQITEDEVYRVDGPMNFSDAWEVVGLDRPDLKDVPLRVSTPAIFESGDSIFDIIRRGDVLLHHPYMPYNIITDFIRQAADDPDVLAIKMCLYRIGEDSPIAPLLIRASEAGKQVTALIEIKARFDEAANLEWGKKLERAGVHVVYGLLGLKTHAKTTLVVRREGDELRRYMHLATGNYNPATSTVYTDLGLLTCDPEIGEDATELFNYLTVYSRRKDYNKLLVAPVNLRQKMLELIRNETENALKGAPARIIAKFNRLADTEITMALYEASLAGVQIDLIVRGVCTLRPGVPGLSDNIRVRSVVGRLLEHSRVYYFENGGDPKVFIGSSDWMPRNLDRRVEVLTPIKEQEIKDFLVREYLQTYLRDNVKARLLGSDGCYHLVPREDGDPDFNAQLAFQDVENVIDFAAR
jgi:polyphosphate kinase